MKKILSILLLASTLTLSGCATVDPATGVRKDPLEGFNRAMWNVNYNYLDPYFLRPIAVGWKEYVPTQAKTILTNISNNLNEPAAFVNRLLEGDFSKAMVHFNRFWINSTLGIGGMFDWASASKDLRLYEERRFGDTLGVYGVGTGSYIVLPGLGGTTPRQGIGNLADNAYPMLSLIQPWLWAKMAVDVVDTRANLLGTDTILEQSADPYITFREAYFQNLNFRIHDGKLPTSPLAPKLSQQELNEID